MSDLPSSNDLPAGLDSGTYNLTFDSEFNNSSEPLNVAQGGPYENSWGSLRWFPANAEQEEYVDPSMGLNPFSYSNGDLVITANPTTAAAKADGVTQPYTSGLIHTEATFTQQYGYFEMNAELPAGQGYWPAFWLYTTAAATHDEIDVMEALGNNTGTVYQSWHTASASHTQPVSVSNYSTGFHTYGVEWSPTALTFFVDGVKTSQVANPFGSNPAPMYLIANLAVGGNWPGDPNSTTPFPGNMQINYIRAYQNSSWNSSTPVAGSTPVVIGSGGGGGTTTPITVSAPGTVTGTLPYTENITLTDTSLANQTVYYAVFNSSGTAEAAFQAITLDSSGAATASMTFKSSGDYVVAESNTTTAANKGQSTPITVNAPSTTPITISAPGTVTGTLPYTENITLTDASLANQTVYYAVFNSSGTAEAAFQAVTLNSSGAATASMTFKNSGDYVVAESNTTTAANKGQSTPITVNAPPPAPITISAPGTVTGTLPYTENITLTDASLANQTVYYAVFNSSGTAEAAFQAVTLNSSGAATASMTFKNSGDYVVAESNTTTAANEGKSTPITVNAPPPAPITISAPGTVTGTLPYTENITLTDASLANQTVYYAIFNSSGTAEAAFQAITLNSSGVATAPMTFKSSGDYVVAESNTTTAANKGQSTPITVNAPAPGTLITVSNPGTVTVARFHSAIVAEYFSDPGLTGIYARVMTSANQAESRWTWVQFNAQGQGAASMWFAHSGDYVQAVNNPTTPTDMGHSSPITIKYV